MLLLITVFIRGVYHVTDNWQTDDMLCSRYGHLLCCQLPAKCAQCVVAAYQQRNGWKQCPNDVTLNKILVGCEWQHLSVKAFVTHGQWSPTFSTCTKQRCTAGNLGNELPQTYCPRPGSASPSYCRKERLSMSWIRWISVSDSSSGVVCTADDFLTTSDSSVA